MTTRQMIISIAENGEAKAAGLQVFDVIESYNETPVRKSEDLIYAIQRAQEANQQTVEIKIWRNQELLSLKARTARLGVELVDKLWKDGSNVEKARFTGTTLKEAIAAYTGTVININHAEPTKFASAQLIAACEDHFVIGHSGNFMRFPYSSVLSTVEHPSTLMLVISVNHLVVYKGAFGMGMSMPVSDFSG